MSDLSHQGAFRLIYSRRLTRAEQDALQSHLRHCPECRQDAEMAGLFSHHLVLKVLPTRPSPRFTAVYMESAVRRFRRNQITKQIYVAGGAVALAFLMLAGWFIIRNNILTTGFVAVPDLPPVAIPESQATAQTSAPEEVAAEQVEPDVDVAIQNEQLIAAIKAGDTAEVEQLLANGVNPDFVDQWGNSEPLPLAAKNGNLEIVRLLVEEGADANSTMNGLAPDRDPLTAAPALLYAAAWGHADVVEYLLANGADPNLAETSEGDVALHHAAWFAYGNIEIVNALLAHGAKVDVRRTAPDGMTPLHWAAAAGWTEAAEALIQAGADVNLQDLASGSEKTPLLLLIYNAPPIRQVDMTNLLLNSGADVNLASAGGKTPLMAAIQARVSLGLTEQLALLLEARADPDLQDNFGDSALHYAARESKKEAVALLIEHGASLDIKNDQGHTPLDLAANKNIGEILREAGAE